jgi:hypothetical protein
MPLYSLRFKNTYSWSNYYTWAQSNESTAKLIKGLIAWSNTD